MTSAIAQQDRIGYFSTLCQELYNPKTTSERDQVQKILEASFPTFSTETNKLDLGQTPSFGIQTPTDTANALRILLENSPNPYVQTFSFSRLKQLVIAQFSLFDHDTKLQLRTFLLEYAYLHTDLQPFVMTQLASVFALLTRFGWLDHEEYQHVYEDMTQFLRASASHRIVGLQILAVVIQDINSVTLPKYSAKFRKAAAGLRDTQLLKIFENGFEILRGTLTRSIPFDQGKTKEVALDLLLKCLSFDFAGTSLDESNDDLGNVQIPSSWRAIYERPEFVSTFFEAYKQLPSSLATKAMDCLVQIAATRKALFSGEDERSKFVTSIMHGVQDIILTSQHLNDSDCYNGFCRLLQRFRTTAPLNEMAEKQGYMEWIELVADFTLKAFQTYTPTNTCFHLLSFWSRIVQSMTYYQQLEKAVVQKLQSITIELTKRFIAAYVDSVSARIEELLDDPLDDEDTLVESLTMLGQVARCQYEQSCTALIEIFDPIASHYEELISQATMGAISGESLKEAIEVFEAKFAWMVYVMAFFVGNRPPYANSDESDQMDGELVTKVLQMMEINQNLSQTNPSFQSQKFELALLYFFSQFRKAYVGESTGNAVYQKLNQVFGLEEEGDMLNLIMRKIINNLQVWGESELIILKTLELFNELASGYSALRNLRKIESTTMIMQNHLSSEFGFFNHDKHRHSRMLYYQVLCKILFAEDSSEQEFYEFMKPFEVRLESLCALNTIEAYQQPQVQNALVAIFRDLRGFIEPIQSRKNYLLFFHWFYPDYMPVLIKGVQALSPDPSTHVLLKFFVEFVSNKSQRLSLDVSSANGVLLFRDASQILTIFGQHITSRHITDESKKYPLKYKGMTACFNILARCLGGKYINFGIFWLYQDKAIRDAFSTMYQLMLNIPLDDLMNFPKLSKAFFDMMDEFSAEQMMLDADMPPEAFLYLLEACELGIESTDSWVRTHACSTIYNICSFLIQQTQKAEIRRDAKGQKNKPVQGLWFLNYFEQFPQVLPKLLSSLFGMILFDDNSDQWQLSRPLYTLVLLQRDFASNTQTK
ncbi:armadillo-type protein [Choanephora cucurbitarum]|nr:armadillo-type protein [Choanephora cucurbitarum]